MNKNFMLGAANRIITPPLGTNLQGYPMERPASAVHDDLRVNVVAVGNGKVDALIINMDLSTLGDELPQSMISLINEKNGISKDRIMINVTHTHSGPSLIKLNGWSSGVNDTYLNNILIPQMLEAVTEAIENAVHAVMGIGTTNSKVGVNRRELTREGKIILGQNPYGIYDPEMTVMSFKDINGNPLVNIIHYGAHATAAGETFEITRDWPGIMVDRMEAETGAMTVFINGAEGDVGPRVANGTTKGDIKQMEEVGSLAALDAIRAYRKIKEYREVDFRTVSDTISLPYKKFPTLEEAYKELEDMGNPEELIDVNFLKYSNLKKRIKLLESAQEIETEYRIQQILFAFNSVVLVPFRFEMASEITLRLRKHSPFEHTLGMMYTNGAVLYLPTRDQLCRGGYEVDMFLYGGVYSFAENTDDNIINENLRVIEMLK